MQLFSSITRTDTDVPRHAEPHSRYLDRSGRAEAERVRNTFQDWFDHYPQEHQPELHSRFHIDDDFQFLSAAFELYVHELLLRVGYTVEVHPVLPSASAKRPDFLASAGAEDRVYVEAVLATDASAAKRGELQRKNTVYDTLAKLQSPDFWVGLELSGGPATPPPGAKLRGELERWLAKLDYAQVERDWQSGQRSPASIYPFEHDGWKILFFAIPKVKYRGRTDVRPLGTFLHEPRFVSDDEVIRQALLDKGGRYGDLNVPYVIAVNVLGWFADKVDMMEALFGTESWVVSMLPDGRPSEPQFQRQPNGFWRGPDGPRYTRVSGVLACRAVDPWQVARRDARLYHNPVAQFPYAGRLTQLSQAVPVDDRLEPRDGTRPCTLFGHPPEWPESFSTK